MAKLVEEHDDGQDEQERQDIAGCRRTELPNQAAKSMLSVPLCQVRARRRSARRRCGAPRRRARLPRRSLPARVVRRRLQARGDGFLDYSGYFKEADPARQEGRHRYLIGGAEDIGRPAARIKGRPGDAERREPIAIRPLERQNADRREIEPPNRDRIPLRPGQAMGDRRPHVGRAQAGQHRAVGELDQAMHDRLRVDRARRASSGGCSKR